MKTKQNNRFFKHPLFLGLAALVLLGAVLAVLEKTNVIDFYHQEPPAAATTNSNLNDGNDPESKIDLTPAKPSDNADTDKAKADAGTPTSNPASGAHITATNVNSETLRVGTLVSGVTSGTCVATFTLDSDSSKTAQTSSSVTTDVSGNYTCGALVMDKAKLPQSGSYSVFVTLDGVKSNTLTAISITK